jgi:hypothetical protein
LKHEDLAIQVLADEPAVGERPQIDNVDRIGWK